MYYYVIQLNSKKDPMCNTTGLLLRSSTHEPAIGLKYHK